MKAILMAGGFGTRIQPLTHAVPKPMVPLLNRPMMEHIIEKLQAASITEIVVLLYHMPEVIHDYFGDGRAFGVRLEYVLPDDDYGTAGAVKQAAAHLDETFLLMSGDLVTDFNLERIIAFHREKQTPVTITLTSVPNPLEFGVVITDAKGRILRFLEKPGWGEVFSDTVNTGIYVLEPEVLDRIPAGRPFDFSKDLFPIYMNEAIPIYGYNATGYWRDVGNTDAYRDAVLDVLRGEGRLDFPGKAHPHGEGMVWLEDEATRLPASLHVSGNVVVGRGARLGENVTLEDAVVGPGSVVGDSGSLTRSVLWRDVRVGANNCLVDAVLCDEVETGDGVRMDKGAIVAGGTEVGDGATFEKDILVFPDKKIEAGATLSANLVFGDKWKKSVFQGAQVRGNTNVELSPEFSAKMGAALGSTLPRGSAILVSRDYLRASRMLKRAFLGGILSTGVNVHDVKMTPVPVARYKLAGFGEEAGVHFQQSGYSVHQTEIAFYDQDGNAIDTGQEKAIERLFFKENFRRVGHWEVGEIQELGSIPEFYKEGFLRALDVEAIRARRYRVVLDLGYGTTGDYLPTLLNRLGCQPVVLNAYPDERRLMRRSREIPEALEQVGEIVRTLNADAGFCLSPAGGYLNVVDDTGQVQPPHRTSMLFLYLLSITLSRPVRAFVPVTEPRVMDANASVLVNRGKTSSVRTSEMHDCDFITLGEGQYAFPDFLHVPDAMFAVAKLLELLSNAGLRISEAYGSLPGYARCTAQLNCPVELKGLAMRRMSEDSVDKDPDLVDGIQVNVDSGSVLLLPDPYRPVLHLVAEAPAPELAEALLDRYEAKVAEWLENG